MIVGLVWQSFGESVAMAGRLRDDQKPRDSGGWVADPVPSFGQDADSAAGLQ